MNGSKETTDAVGHDNDNVMHKVYLNFIQNIHTTQNINGCEVRTSRWYAISDEHLV